MLEYDVKEFFGKSPMSIGIEAFSASPGDQIKIEEISISDRFGHPCRIDNLIIDGVPQFCTAAGMPSSIFRSHRAVYRSYSKELPPSLTKNQKIQGDRESEFNSSGPLAQDWRWISSVMEIVADAPEIMVTIGFRTISPSHAQFQSGHDPLLAERASIEPPQNSDRAQRIEDIKFRVRNGKEGIPMLLRCPSCHERHIDEGKWATKPHHTHACQHCGEVWRPAILNTVGVQFLPGFK